MKKIRLMKGITLDDIYVVSERRLGQSKLSRIERGIVVPNREEKTLIARALDEQVNVVFPEDEHGNC